MAAAKPHIVVNPLKGKGFRGVWWFSIDIYRRWRICYGKEVELFVFRGWGLRVWLEVGQKDWLRGEFVMQQGTNCKFAPARGIILRRR